MIGFAVFVLAATLAGAIAVVVLVRLVFALGKLAFLLFCLAVNLIVMILPPLPERKPRIVTRHTTVDGFLKAVRENDK